MKTVEIVLCFLFILFYFLTKKSELLIFANASFASFFHGISQNRLGKKRLQKERCENKNIIDNTFCITAGVILLRRH